MPLAEDIQPSMESRDSDDEQRDDEQEEDPRLVEDLITAMREEEENLVQKEGNRRRDTCREVQLMVEIPVSTDATRQSELEPNKENMDEETPSAMEI